MKKLAPMIMKSPQAFLSASFDQALTTVERERFIQETVRVFLYGISQN